MENNYYLNSGFSLFIVSREDRAWIWDLMEMGEMVKGGERYVCGGDERKSDSSGLK